MLLNELQTDADRPNVELARLAGLSPAATLNRVRRLKESGVIEGIHAKLDREQAGFGLCVYVSVTLGAHEEALERRFQDVVHELPEVTAAAWVAGETDALLTVNCRDLTELQHVLTRLRHQGRRAAGRHPPAPARAEARLAPPARRSPPAALTSSREMAVSMRLTRVGGKKDPVWRVVVADSRSPRDGRVIETIGRYNAQTDPSTIQIDEERARYWLGHGAQPSDTVKKLLKIQGV